ncbi:uncharacterized protein LOC122350716 [Puntigrus tetrazona]|uniref:uncharacterized protein LOC122350716 n=1 Tax=Puntigrus tetrazona TaxID=1606681 RepID=UPI001C89CCB6|nr:uncharacterized protein LOC122350716 [Puntigrus tetrazona]
MRSLVCLLSYLTAVKAGSHSLMVFATYIAGQTEFPEFTLVLMLDDVEVIYYDSASLKAVYRSQSNSSDDNVAGSIFGDIYDLMKDRTFYLKDHQNCTDGLHVYQKRVGCELLDNDQPGLFLSWDAFNGQNTEEFTFDVVKRTMQMNLPWMRIKGMGQMEWLHVKFLYEHVYHPICIKTLRAFLEKEKNTVTRKLKPRVRLMKKTLSDSGGLQISCLATGFYPRHINLTLFRDGQPVDEDQITGGEILPNGDGTYQMRKTLVIAEEELNDAYYKCTANYLNLDNKLDIAFDEDLEKSDFGSSALSIIISVLVLIFVAVFVIIALINWRMRRAAEPGSSTSQQSGYSPTSSSHSLMALATYIVGQTPFPEFSAVLMLDDVQIGYYDSVTWSVMHRTPRDSKYQNEEKSDADIVFLNMYNTMKEREVYFKEHINHTNGLHVQQRIAGCELLDNDKPGPLQRWDAFNGQEIGEYTFDTEKNVQTKIIWGPWGQLTRLHMRFLCENIYQPICIKVLRRYLYVKKNSVMRKVKPRVRLMKKTLSDSGGLQISCLATGFYPRHINLTLFRDGQPVDDDQITGGEILPNGDGTYQMRKTLVIAEEELREEHKYNCSMKRLSLDNKLDIISDVAESDPGSSTQSVVFSVMVFMFVAVLIITALIVWRKRRAAEQAFKKSQSDYSLTASSTND